MKASESQRRVIINADDLGRTPGINQGIFEAHSRGLVTSATLMVCYPAAQEAVAQLASYPELGIGLHVAMTGQKSLLDPELVQSLVDSDGRFPAKPEGLDDPDPAEVLAEAEAQFARFLELRGCLPTHLDSHHHSHRHPVVLEALVTLAKRHGLPVRSSSAQIQERLRSEGIATTDHFVESFFDERAQLAELLEILETLSDGSTEIMCHPAYVDEELSSSSSYTTARERELEVLQHPDALRAIRELGIELAHFGTP